MAKVELVYVNVEKKVLQFDLEFIPNMTVATVIEHSGLWHNYPETKNFIVGIFGKPVSLDALVQAGDRVEIYRPLSHDPKEKRRQRAKNK